MMFESLLTRHPKQDMQSLAALHDQLYPLVYRYVNYRLADQQACEDITSEAFVRLVNVITGHGRPVRDMRAWLLGTAAHLVKDYYRQQYRRPETDLDCCEEMPHGDKSPEQAAEQQQVSLELKQALCCLTEYQQHVLALRFSQAMSLEETARMLGKSINAVKVTQFRALETLRRVMDERGIPL